MSTVQTKIYTPEDLLAMPDSCGVELVNGNLVEKPVSVLSGLVVARTSRLLDAYCHSHRLGVVLSSSNGLQCFPNDPDNIRKPSLTFVKRERLSQKHLREDFLTIAPDLAVEVVSAHDQASGLNERVEEYVGAGIPLVWVIDPLNEIIMIHRGDGSTAKLRRHDRLSGEGIVPGFECTVAELLPELLA